MLSHEAFGNSAGFGVFAASPAKLAIPEEVTLMESDEFSIIGMSKKCKWTDYCYREVAFLKLPHFNRECLSL